MCFLDTTTLIIKIYDYIFDVLIYIKSPYYKSAVDNIKLLEHQIFKTLELKKYIFKVPIIGIYFNSLLVNYIKNNILY